MRLKQGAVWTAALAVVLLGAWAAEAQTTDRAGIEGKVVDQGGGAVPGVTVTLASPALLGGPRTTLTDVGGRYRFAAMPAGTYQIAFELVGFAPVKRELRLDTGFVATINETLSVGAITETVTVEPKSPVVDETSMADPGTAPIPDPGHTVGGGEPGMPRNAARAHPGDPCQTTKYHNPSLVA